MILAVKAATISAGEAYWMGIWNTASTAFDRGDGIFVYNNQDIYVVGTRWDGTNINGVLIKFDQTPDVLWGRRISTAADTTLRRVATDGTQVFAVGNEIYEYNASGTLQYQRDYARGANGFSARTASVTSTGTLTFAGDSNTRISFGEMSGTGGNTLAKFYEPTSTLTGNGHAIDSSNNFYLISNGSGYGNLVKANSAGAIQWNVRYGNGSNSHLAIATTSAGDNYIGHQYTDAPASMGALKFNSSGSLIWQRKLATTDAITVTGCAIDSDENVYVSGFVQSATNVGLLAKWNSSGTLQWQRTFASNDGNMRLSAVTCDANKTVYVSGRLVDGSQDVGFIAKLPPDGSKTGAYAFSTVTVTYATSTYTGSTPTQTTTSIGDTTVTDLTQSTPTNTETSVTVTDEYKAL